MEEGDVAKQGDDARGTPSVCLAGLGGQRHAHCLCDRAVDAGGAAGRVGVHAVEGQAYQGGVAHRIGSAQDQGVIDRQRVSHRCRDVQSGKAQLGIFEGLADGVGSHLRCTLADLQPLAGRLTANLDCGSQGCGITAWVGEVGGAGEHDEVDVWIVDKGQHAAVQRGVSDHDDLLDLGVDHVVVGGDLGAAEDVRRCRVHRVIRCGRGRLSDGGNVLEAFDLPGFVAGDDEGVLAQVHGYLAVV